MEELYTSGEGGEPDVYFYHSDHLGSSSFITDGNGDATQHLQYLPFGEDFIHQQSTSAYYSPFTFSGKERDAETSLSYFGARYYDAGLSIWLSVDPMSDKYQHQSPFTYCAWSPIMVVDPDGNEEYELNQSNGKITKVSDVKYYKGADGEVSTVETEGSVEVDRMQDQKGGEMYVSAGILGKPRMVGGENTESKGIFYNFGNSDEAEDFYQFVARGSDVEWGFGRIKETHGGGGIVGTSGAPGHSSISGILEASYGNAFSLLSHSHPNGGMPSFELFVKGKKGRQGDLNAALRSSIDPQREVFDVPNNIIYIYSKATLNRAKSGDRPYDDTRKPR